VVFSNRPSSGLGRWHQARSFLGLVVQRATSTQLGMARSASTLSSSTLKVTRRSSRRTQLLQRIILRRKNARSSEYADALVWPRRSRAAIKGRGRLAIALTSLLLKAGANPIVQCKMAAGHHLRLDCRVPGHCWAFYSGKYDDEKRSALLSFLRPGGAALDVGANIHVA